ncbi:MAG: hypothetical protein OXG42_10595, partial [Chloroflexi bacterium]|nr:hypothetical protein [Chloroflexota bacterium]
RGLRRCEVAGSVASRGSTASRHKLFDQIEAENALIASGHFTYPGLGRAARRNGARYFAAE